MKTVRECLSARFLDMDFKKSKSARITSPDTLHFQLSTFHFWFQSETKYRNNLVVT